MRKVALYFGSFNPLHYGHKAIIEAILSLGEFEQIYLIVSPQNPLKSATNIAHAQERLEAAKLALSDYIAKGRLVVHDIEFSLPCPNYTINTLEALQKLEPDTKFKLVIGADNLAIIKSWRAYSEILLNYGFIVYPRRSCNMEALANDLWQENPKYQIRLLSDCPLNNISSTEIRERGQVYL